MDSCSVCCVSIVSRLIVFRIFRLSRPASFFRCRLFFHLFSEFDAQVKHLFYISCAEVAAGFFTRKSSLSQVHSPFLLYLLFLSFLFSFCLSSFLPSAETNGMTALSLSGETTYSRASAFSGRSGNAKGSDCFDEWCSRGKARDGKSGEGSGPVIC